MADDYQGLHTGEEIDEAVDKINSIGNIGRYLSTWDCTTGLPETDSQTVPYEYATGDYFIVGKIGNTNYKPTGTEYDGTASTTVDSSEIAIADMYYFDGTSWGLLKFSLALKAFVSKSEIDHESWTFTLSDNTTVTKEVATWISTT